MSDKTSCLHINTHSSSVMPTIQLKDRKDPGLFWYSVLNYEILKGKLLCGYVENIKLNSNTVSIKNISGIVWLFSLILEQSKFK